MRLPPRESAPSAASYLHPISARLLQASLPPRCRVRVEIGWDRQFERPVPTAIEVDSRHVSLHERGAETLDVDPNLGAPLTPNFASRRLMMVSLKRATTAIFLMRVTAVGPKTVSATASTVSLQFRAGRATATALTAKPGSNQQTLRPPGPEREVVRSRVQRGSKTMHERTEVSGIEKRADAGVASRV